MHTIFLVIPEDIQNLNDIQARELVSRLCRAELGKKGLSQAFVIWGGDQRAKDGGVDVRIDIAPKVGIDGYLVKDTIVFQVKAEPFGKAKIPKEMAPKNKLRPVIKELASKEGAYVIVGTKDSLSDSSLIERKKAMAECLSAHGLAGKVVLDFYDSRRIADWAEQHPSIVTWLKHTLDKPIQGWQPYAPWAYREDDIEAEYLLDDKVKVFTPDLDEGITVKSAIDYLRSDLGKNVSVRIVGLSGVGKTRLVQALFDDRISTEHLVLDRENVIYTDLSNNPTPQPSAMIEALLSAGSNSVVVVDNCGPDVHQKLTGLIKRPGSQLRLVTVEYDIRDDLPEGTVCYRLDGSSDNVIKGLLKRRYHILSERDIDKITEFSSGNSRVAFALASTSETKGELARLEDTDLFRRMFVQKNEESDELLRCVEIASLLYSFDAEDLSANSELTMLASLADVSAQSFSRNIAELLRRGLVQARGKWRAVLPQAISNRLASRAIESYPKELLITKFIDNATERVARSFSRRLGYLHESRRADEIVERWLSPGGRFGDLIRLNEIEQQIFSNIAPVNQKVTLDALVRGAENKEFVSTDSHYRNHFARIARSLAYEPDLFDQAVEVLTRFAIVEPEGYKHDSIREILKSLFFCHLSGTEALAEQRAAIVRKLVMSGDNAEQKLGLLLLDAALEASHFSSHYEFDFGARKRSYGWWPRTQENVRDWFRPFINIAVEIGMIDSKTGREARIILGQSLRGLWTNAGLVDELTIAAKELVNVNGWSEGWLGIRQTLQWDKKKLSEHSLSALKKLEGELSPRDLNASIRAKVLAARSLAFELDNDDLAEPISSRLQRAQAETEGLGKTAAMDDELLANLLPDLLRGNSTDKIGYFGFGVGQSAFDPRRLLNNARILIESAGPAQLRLMFIRGLISGWYKVNPHEVSSFLDEAISDDVWGVWFPELQMAVNLDNTAYLRLMKALELGKAPGWQFQYLCNGRATDALSVEQISLLINSISARSDNGLPIAIDVLQMVIFCSKEKDTEYRAELTRYCISFLQKLHWLALPIDDANLSYHLYEVIEFTVASSTLEDLENEVLIILSRLVDFMRSERYAFIYHENRLIKSFFNHYPKQTLDAVYLPDDDGSYVTALHILSEQRNIEIETISDNAFIEWCEISPNDRYPFAAHICQLFDETAPSKIDGKIDRALSDISKLIFAKAIDKKLVLEIFIDRFNPGHWSGSLAAILRDRLPFLDEFNPAGNLELKRLVANAKDMFSKRIAREEELEDFEERNQTSSFE